MIADIKLSPEFKSQTTRAVISIFLFVLVYLLLIIFAVGLTAACLYAGIMLIISMPRLITIALGIGLGSLGLLVLGFLIKFIFKSHKVDRSHLTEIKRTDEPKLFNMIDSIVEQVDTTFPKKVYLSADVNASVFYDSSFWSMFFPVRKNLQIGLGLVNSVSEEELKAILAHEFGHFSQKTMKVGSYVYNVNQVIFNMLYDNEAYDKMISNWANASGYFALFAAAAFKIVQAIQWVLQKMYDFVNKSYMGLSREMEFHADEIAANVTGYEPLKNSLLRLQLAGHSYQSVLSFYETKIVDNFKSQNLFKEHSFVMEHLAKDSKIPIEHNFPQVSVEELNKFNKSKLVIKDQWASHPSTEDRVKRLENLSNIPSAKIESSPANSIFQNIEKTQQSLTEKMFSEVTFQEKESYLPLNEFQKDYQEGYLKNSFPKTYNGYYDDKNPISFELNSSNTDTKNLQLDDLFSKAKIELVYTAAALEADLEALKQISDKSSPIKTFDYDGQKYTKKESAQLANKVAKEFTTANMEIKQNDVAIFNFFRALEKKTGTDILPSKYTRFFNAEHESKARYEIYVEMSNHLDFINHNTPFQQIKNNFTALLPLEAELKKGISDLLNDDIYHEEITEEMKTDFDLYLSKDWTYFEFEKYSDKNLGTLYTAMGHYAYLLARGYFLLKKELLDYQEGLLKN